MDKITQLREIVRYLHVAHHIPGRIRIKLKSDAFTVAIDGALQRAQEFQRLVETLPGIRSVRPNLVALSCVVEYDQEQLSHEMWEQLLSGEDSEAVRSVLDRLEQHLLSSPSY